MMVFLNHTRALYFSSALSAYDAQTAITAVGQSTSTSAWRAVFSGQIKFASEAVIVFFVLSGYLVGGSVLRSVRAGRWSWRVYLTKRLSRLYMVLLPAIALGVILDHVGLHFARPGGVYSTPQGIGIIATSFLRDRLRPLVILGNVFFLQGVLVQDVGTNVSIWSLANEFWYYLAFPALVLMLQKSRSFLARCGYGVLALAILWFVGQQISSLFPLWVAGALVVLLPNRLTERQARNGTVVGVVVLLIAMIGVRLLHFRSIEADYVIALATCFFLHFATQQRATTTRGVYRAISGYFSRVSYSLYLFHLPIAVFLCSLVNSPWQPWAKTPRHWIEFFAIDAGILLVVTLLWKAFEANTDKARAFLFEREASTLHHGA